MLIIPIITVISTVFGFDFTQLDLPDDHLPYFLSNFPSVAQECEKDEKCPYKNFLGQSKCWGYESKCSPETRYSKLNCPTDAMGWVNTKEEQLETFYNQADFGYIRNQIHEMSVICEPTYLDDSSLECSGNLRFCRGRNIALNFSDLQQRTEPIRYKMDVLKKGDIGGHCSLHRDRLEANLDHLSPLQSWAPELRFFTELQKKPIVDGGCDVVVSQPTFIMKIDATVNMYHHFCDFFNLYAALHVNSMNEDMFSKDVRMLIWESYSYHSAFKETWEAFTKYPVWDLKHFTGKTVCFKNLIFPLLPRMIFGLYYNTPIIWGCERSGLFRAFSQFILHRLRIPARKRTNGRVRITFLSRDTKFRNVLNERQLVAAMKQIPEYEVQRVVFNKDVSFKKQLEIIRNSDVLIGMHGAGLTHLLFLPDWASVFELYNCEDENCYKDLARLRGLKYITWRQKGKIKQADEGRHPDGKAHAKFTDYSFDADEFLRLVAEAAEHVMTSQGFRALVEKDTHDEL